MNEKDVILACAKLLLETHLYIGSSAKPHSRLANQVMKLWKVVGVNVKIITISNETLSIFTTL